MAAPTKKSKNLTRTEKQYLAHQILFYYFCTAQHINGSPRKSKVSKPKPDKTPETTKEAKLIHRFILSLKVESLPKPAKRAVAVIAGLLIVVLIQLVYPHNRSLPLARLESHGYLGFADEDQILETFADFDSRVITVHTHSKNLTTSYKDLGVTIEPDETVKSVMDYPLSQRFIPFSILSRGNKSYSIKRSLNDSQLAVFVNDVIAEGNKQPKDAAAGLDGTKIVVTPSEEGYEYQVSALRSTVLRSDLADKAQLVFPPTILLPRISSENAQNVAESVQQRIDNPIHIQAESKNMTVDSATIASWVDIVYKPDEKAISMPFNRGRVAESLRSFPAQVDITAIPTIVTYLNGIQAGRVEGSVGKVLQFDELVDRLVATTSLVTGTIEASVATIPPSEVIERKYSRDSAGLQNLLEYWTSKNRGEYSIDIRSLNGRIEANINPHRLFPSFGIYRVYIASMVYGKISSKSITPSTTTQAGLSVSTCLDRMIVSSDDSCTNALGALVGWGASDSMLNAQGFESTTLTEGAGLTTADDSSEWMVKLLTANITSMVQANELTGIMARQPIRSGIPAGSPGIRVANKAGASGRIKHDIGIVYHPNGTYVLSVLSDGSDFKLVADLANEINKVMSQ